MSEQRGGEYAVGPDVPIDPVPPGRNLLVAGPSIGSARSLALALVAAGERRGDGSIVVTTRRDAAAVAADLDRAGGRNAGERRWLVDCTGTDTGGRDRVEGLASPEDMTGITIGLSDAYRGLADRRTTAVRVGFDSVTTLLTYAEARTALRFVHTLTGRIAAMDSLGVFVLDPSAHDDQTVGTITKLFDARLDVRDVDDGPEIRVRGSVDGPSGWTPIDLPGY